MESKQIRPPERAWQVDLRRELAASGIFAHSTIGSLGKFLSLAIVGLIVWFVSLSLPLWALVPIAIVTAVPLVAAAMCGHEAGHGSFSKVPWQNEALLHVAFPLLTGLGVLHWKQKHNVLHHGHPNVVGIDDDIDLWPMALSEQAYLESSPPRRWFQKHLQGYLFWPLTLFLAFVMRYETAKGNVRAAKKRGIDATLLCDVACQLTHYALFLGLPIYFFGWLPALLFYVVTWSVGGLLLTLIFIPAHVGLPLVATEKNGWEHQLASTRNLHLPPVISWLFVGLDSQVEHHLFPRITHQRLPAAQTIVRRFCASRDLPYHEVTYLAALRNSSDFLFAAWRTPAAAASDALANTGDVS